ncbi:hypothetical protein KXD40_003479 [Peronospora effusa]|nr:hypothetical protein KXD40_003479 [Peronospora effusa]
MESWKDSITSLVNSTRESTFHGFEALQNQLLATQKSMADHASAAAESVSNVASNASEKIKPADPNPSLMDRASGAISSSVDYTANHDKNDKNLYQMADMKSKTNAHHDDVNRAKEQIDETTQKADSYLTSLTKNVEEYEKKHSNFEPAGKYLKSALDASRSATQKLKTQGQDLSERSVPVAIEGMRGVRESLDDLQKRAVEYDDKYAKSRGQTAMDTLHHWVNNGRQHATDAVETTNDQLMKLRDAIGNMAGQATLGAQVAVGEAVRAAEFGDEKLGVSSTAGGVVQKMRDLDARLGVSATAAKVDSKVTGGLGCKVASTTVDIVTESVSYISDTLHNAKLAAQQSETAQGIEARGVALGEAAVDTKNELQSTYNEAYEKGRAMAGMATEKSEETAKEVKDTTKEKAGQAKDKAVEAKDMTKEKAGQAKNKAKDEAEMAKDKAGQAKDMTVEKAGQAKDMAKEKAGQATNKVGEVKDMAGEKAGQAKDMAKEKAGQATNKAGEMKDMAAERAGQAKDMAKEKAGMAKDKASDTAGQAKDKASETADQAKHKAGNVKEQTKEKAGDAKDMTQDRAVQAKEAAKDATGMTKEETDHSKEKESKHMPKGSK